MIKKIKKIWNYLIMVSKAKKSWRTPNPSQILVYDASGVDLLLKYIEKWNPEVLHIRGEEINLQILFYSFFQSGAQHVNYFDEYIKNVSPKLIITCTDNSKFFYEISNRHKSVKTLFIQNGIRAHYGDIFETLESCDTNDYKNFKVDYMMTCGQNIGDYFLKYISGSVIPMGIIKNNIIPKKNTTQDGLMVYISQVLLSEILINGEMYNIEKFSKKVERPILKVLQAYADLNLKKFMIIPRNPKNTNARKLEENHYQSMLKNKAQFLDLDHEYSSYFACDMAEVVVSVDSTLAFESIARGNKTAVFSIRGDIYGLKGYDYGWPGNFSDSGPFWTNYSDSHSFETILDYLFEADEAKWQEDLSSTFFSSVMKYDNGNSALQSTLHKIIEAKEL